MNNEIKCYLEKEKPAYIYIINNEYCDFDEFKEEIKLNRKGTYYLILHSKFRNRIIEGTL